MIIKKEKLTVEYTSDTERNEHIAEMKGKGYKVVEIRDGVDINAMNHLYAEFEIERQGYKGESIYKRVL